MKIYKTFFIVLIFIVSFSCAGFQIKKENYETLNSILDNFQLKRDSKGISLEDKYQALLKFVQESEESKWIPINSITRNAFPECNAIRYLEIKKTQRISNELKIERDLYFTAFNTIFDAGYRYTPVILRVRIVIESIRKKKENRFISTFTLEDRGYDNPDNGSSPDGKIDRVIRSNINLPIMKDRDFQQNDESISPLYQEAFNKAVAIFYDEYMF